MRSFHRFLPGTYLNSFCASVIVPNSSLNISLVTMAELLIAFSSMLTRDAPTCIGCPRGYETIAIAGKSRGVLTNYRVRLNLKLENV